MIKRLFLCLSVLCLAALTSNGSYGSAEPPVTPSAPALSKSLRAGLDAALEEGRSFSGAPAATATVIRCGRVLWSGASGVKNIRSRPPTTPDTPFVVASSTKPITAALVLHLVEGGDLSLNTKLSRFYPDLPRAGTITVRMLLNHTSGLNEYFDDPQIIHAIIHDPDHDWNRAEVLRGITSTKFKPGTRYSYSNSAYVILGGMIKKLTGDTVEQVFRRVIADPLGGRYVGYESELWHDESHGVTVAVNTNTEKSSLATWKKIVAAYDEAMPNTRPCGSA